LFISAEILPEILNWPLTTNVPIPSASVGDNEPLIVILFPETICISVFAL
jgi:hypothetical protein